MAWKPIPPPKVPPSYEVYLDQCVVRLGLYAVLAKNYEKLSNGRFSEKNCIHRLLKHCRRFEESYEKSHLVKGKRNAIAATDYLLERLPEDTRCVMVRFEWWLDDKDDQEIRLFLMRFLKDLNFDNKEESSYHTKLLGTVESFFKEHLTYHFKRLKKSFEKDATHIYSELVKDDDMHRKVIQYCRQLNERKQCKQCSEVFNRTVTLKLHRKNPCSDIFLWLKASMTKTFYLLSWEKALFQDFPKNSDIVKNIKAILRKYLRNSFDVRLNGTGKFPTKASIKRPVWGGKPPTLLGKIHR